MNVIVTNRLKEITSSLNIDVSEILDGTYTVDDLTTKFDTVFFNRMIIDITALKSRKFNDFQKLAISFDTSRIILLIADEDINNPVFLSEIISLGIYNYATNRDAILYLYNNPNHYRDVASKHSLDITVTSDVTSSKKLAPVSVKDIVKTPEMAFKPKEKVEFEANIDTSVFPKVVGFRNLTEHAGATTLIYMLHKELSKYFRVAAVEIDKSDFLYLAYRDFFSTTSLRLNRDLQKIADYDIILLDLNDYDSTSLCEETIYLLEPTTIKLNKAIRKYKNLGMMLENSKTVLNKSYLSKSDVKDFENEVNINIFHNIAYINERFTDQSIIVLLKKLGFFR